MLGLVEVADEERVAVFEGACVDCCGAECGAGDGWSGELFGELGDLPGFGVAACEEECGVVCGGLLGGGEDHRFGWVAGHWVCCAWVDRVHLLGERCCCGELLSDLCWGGDGEGECFVAVGFDKELCEGLSIVGEGLCDALGGCWVVDAFVDPGEDGVGVSGDHREVGPDPESEGGVGALVPCFDGDGAGVVDLIEDGLV